MSGMEILVIILVVLLLFGADRLPELAGTMGEA
ncbi:MAG: twin-arginine translocase TatA/TatE family subunit [Bacteroidales bacterium]